MSAVPYSGALSTITSLPSQLLLLLLRLNCSLCSLHYLRRYWNFRFGCFNELISLKSHIYSRICIIGRSSSRRRIVRWHKVRFLLIPQPIFLFMVFSIYNSLTKASRGLLFLPVTSYYLYLGTVIARKPPEQVDLFICHFTFSFDYKFSYYFEIPTLDLPQSRGLLFRSVDVRWYKYRLFI